MKISTTHQRRSFVLSCIAAAGCIAAAFSCSHAVAHDTVPTPASQVQANSIQGIEHQDDWCVWTESNTCNYQPDDELQNTDLVIQSNRSSQSALLPTSQPTRSRTASNFESSLAAVAATACARAGISVEQIVEPFAMVGNRTDNSIEQVAQLQNWWAATQRSVESQYAALVEAADLKAEEEKRQNIAAAADTVADDVIQGDVVESKFVSLVPLVDFRQQLTLSNDWSPLLASVPLATQGIENDDVNDPIDFVRAPRDDASSAIAATQRVAREQLDKLAMEEPIDTNADSSGMLGHSILVAQSNQSAKVSKAATTNPSLVGSSAMIVTIAEVYMPYDLAARDVQWSSALPMSKRPFCIRNRQELPGLPPEAETLPLAVNTPATEAPAKIASRQQDDSQHDIGDAVKQLRRPAKQIARTTKKLYRSIQPAPLGRQLGNLIATGNRLTRQASHQLAAAWPSTGAVADIVQNAVPAGDQLLARADASAVAIEATNQIDPDETLVQWIAVAVNSGRQVQSLAGKLWPRQSQDEAVQVAQPQNDSSRR